MSTFVVHWSLAVLSAAGVRAQEPGNEWFFAARDGDAAKLNAMLNEGAPVDRRGVGRQTALLFAASGGHAEAVVLLLRAGADVEARDEAGVTALMNAAGMGHGPVVQILLAARADPNAMAEGGVGPLLAAAVGGPHHEILKALLDAGADLDGLLGHRKHPESAVRVRIFMALASVGPQARKAVPQLAEALADDHLNVRYWAAFTLKSLGPEAAAAAPQLIEALQTHPDRSPGLEGPLRYHADVRWIAADALGEIGEPSAIPALRKALTDESGDVRDAARTALNKLGANSAPNR
jgi:hypothetical protein